MRLDVWSNSFLPNVSKPVTATGVNCSDNFTFLVHLFFYHYFYYYNYYLKLKLHARGLRVGKQLRHLSTWRPFRPYTTPIVFFF